MIRQQIFGALLIVSGLFVTTILAADRVSATPRFLAALAQSPFRSAAGIHADLGAGFTYQGFVQDNGAPIDNNCDFLFSLYDAAAGGQSFGTAEPEAGVKVIEGRFTVQLNEAGQFEEAFNGGARWLQVAMRCPAGSGEYTTLSPRQELTAAPYALSLRPGATISGTTSAGILNLSNSSGQGLVVDSAATEGLRINAAGGDGAHISAAGNNGLSVNLANRNGIEVGAAGLDGVYIGSAGDDGVEVFQASDNGLRVGDASSNGIYVEAADINGLRVGSADVNGVRVDGAGVNGLHVQAAGNAGLFVQSAFNGVQVESASGWAGLFDGSVLITGNCIGCATTLFGRNGSNEPLAPGAIVALRSVSTQPQEVTGAPVLIEVGPALPGEAIVGVVAGRAELVSAAAADDEQRPQLIPNEGTAGPGEYLIILIDGIAQVQAGALTDPIAAGDRLTVDTAGVARGLQTRELDGMMITEGAPGVGIALEGLEAGEEGMIWVLVNPH